MPPTDSADSTSRLTYLSRLDQTNSLISLANSSIPSSAVSLLSVSLSDPTSFANSSPTFEALNRVTFAYALIRTGEIEKGRSELEKVARLIIFDDGRTEYFAKIRERAKVVVEKRKLGIIVGINDKDYPKAGSSSRPVVRSKQAPLDVDLLLDFAEMDLNRGGGCGGDKSEEAKETLWGNENWEMNSS